MKVSARIKATSKQRFRTMLDHLCLRLQDREHQCGNLLSEPRKVLLPVLSSNETLPKLVQLPVRR